MRRAMRNAGSSAEEIAELPPVPVETCWVRLPFHAKGAKIRSLDG
jgi:hypothetical protein